MTEDGRNTVA